MKKIYSKATQDLIDTLTQQLEFETKLVIDALASEKPSGNRVRVELQCNPALNSIRNELHRIHAVAIPVRYKFKTTQGQ